VFNAEYRVFRKKQPNKKNPQETPNKPRNPPKETKRKPIRTHPKPSNKETPKTILPLLSSLMKVSFVVVFELPVFPRELLWFMSRRTRTYTPVVGWGVFLFVFITSS